MTTHAPGCGCGCQEEIVITPQAPVVVDVVVNNNTTGPVGPVVIDSSRGGAIGPTGPTGPTGPDRALAYEYTKGVASATWEIIHNLNFYPNVTVEDSSHSVCEGEIEYTNPNKVIIRFSQPISGIAYLS